MTAHEAVSSWLVRHATDVPGGLRARVIDAVHEYAPAGVPLPVALRTVADCVFQDALSSADSRAGATTLLTADALITYACEALAEQNPALLANLL